MFHNMDKLCIRVEKLAQRVKVLETLLRQKKKEQLPNYSEGFIQFDNPALKQ